MRTWGVSGAAAAIRRAQAASDYARRTGCPVDEAPGLLAAAGESTNAVPRRRFLLGTAAGAGTVALSALPTAARAAARTTEAKPRVVIAGAGIAGLGCAWRLWQQHGIRASVHEFNTRPGGRIATLRGHFADGQIVEEHAEFINPEHTATLALARAFGLRLDDDDAYPAGTHPGRQTLRFHGRPWSQAAVDRDWHDWAWKLFHHTAFTVAPWPQLWNHHTAAGQRLDRMTVPEWIDANIPGGMASDFGALCVSAVLDEYGGPPDQQSALNLVYLLGLDDSTSSGAQPHRSPVLGGADEKWHIHGGNDQLITGLISRLPSGTVHLGQRLVAVRPAGSHGYRCTFERDGTTADVLADHVVLAMPFTTLRQVDLTGVPIPARHRRAIAAEPLGTNAKFFLQFRSRLWNAEHATGNSYCGGVVQGAWDASLHQAGTAGILAALPGGRSGQDWGPRYHLAGYRGSAPAPMARAFLHGFDHLFPGLDAVWNGRSWYVWSAGDPHILGAYSYLKPGQYTSFNGIQGQREGHLHFAGEQTSVNFQGYIEGGLRSGYRCATEIAAAT